MITDYGRCVYVFRVFGFCPKKKKKSNMHFGFNLGRGDQGWPYYL